MQNLIINEKEVDLPESWTEVSWTQGCELIELSERKDLDEKRIIFHVVSICTGFPPKFWQQFEDIPQFQAIANGLAWAFRQDLALQEVEKMKGASWRRIEYQGKTYEMPEDISTLTAAQYIDASAVSQNFVQTETEKEKENTPELTADDILSSKKHLFCIYFQGIIDGEYDYQKAIELNIDSIPFIKVIRWADFFLIKLIGLTSGTKAKRNILGLIKKKLSQAMKS